MVFDAEFRDETAALMRDIMDMEVEESEMEESMEEPAVVALTTAGAMKAMVPSSEEFLSVLAKKDAEIMALKSETDALTSENDALQSEKDALQSEKDADALDSRIVA